MEVEKISSLENSSVIVSASLIAQNNENVYDDGVDDDILLQASQILEAAEQNVIPSSSDTYSNTFVKQPTSSRFGIPQSASDLKIIKDSGVPYQTKQSTKWASNAWKAWSEARADVAIEESECMYPLSGDISTMNRESIAFWLPRFVVEARKENSLQYPPNSL